MAAADDARQRSRSRTFQAVAALTGTIILLYALGLFFGFAAFRQLWIWPTAPALGLAFVGSWLAGVAAPLVWIGITGTLRAVQGGAIGGVVAFGGSAALLWVRSGPPDKERYLPFAVLFLAGALGALALVIRSVRAASSRATADARSDRPSPRAVRWTFLLFAAILLTVGLAMASGVRGIFPMPLTPDTTQLYGWFFLGSCAYYLFGFLKPSMLNATGHMLSFLVYDALLLPPFAGYWPVVAPEYRLALFLYLTVLATSAVFCIYFLVVEPRRR